MALFVESQTRNNTLRHFCRICKKGFRCGRALGGHMRAHGIGGEDSPATQNSDFDEDEDDNDFGNDDWDAAETSNKAGNHPPSSKRMYSLRTNPSNRLRSCRACENCGKEFGSWKSFLEHGKCISGDAESLVSADSGDDRSPGGGCGNWSKRKRSFRVKVENLINHNNNTGQNNMQMCPSSEEEDLANCLMMLSNAAVDPVDAAEPEESCASASRDEMEQLRKNNTTTPTTTVSLNHFNISPTSFRVPETAITNYNNNANGNNVHKAKGVGTAAASTATTTNTKPGLFECKACKKVFNSHQALGGHRASHKKVKGCFAARLYSNEDTAAAANENSTAALNEDPQFFPMKSASNPPLLASDSGGSYGGTKRKSKAHECTICHRIFSSGQALGGHKRCHWITSNSSASMSKPGSEATTALAKFQQFQEGIEQINLAAVTAAAVVAQSQANNTATTTAALDLKLDLNLPAPPTSLPETEMYLQPWIGSSSGSKRDHFRHCDNDHELGNHNTVVTDDADQFHNNGNKALNSTIITSTSSAAVMEDEAESKVKLSKLSELKDINMSEGSSWLQVGICSITDARSNVP